jgi:hypothetical protein
MSMGKWLTGGYPKSSDDDELRNSRAEIGSKVGRAMQTAIRCFILVGGEVGHFHDPGRPYLHARGVLRLRLCFNRRLSRMPNLTVNIGGILNTTKPTAI